MIGLPGLIRLYFESFFTPAIEIGRAKHTRDIAQPPILQFFTKKISHH